MKATKFAAHFILVCAALLVASCSPFSRNQLSNLRMTTDQTGKTTATVYTPLQEFCVFADVRGIKTGSVIQARWIATKAQGVAPDTKINTSDYIYQPGVAHVYFKLATWDDSSWPVGSYRVDLFVDGKPAGQQTFSVQQ